MDLYLDKTNLCSLIRAKNDTEEELYSECSRLLRKHMHLIFNFDKQSCLSDPALLPWLLGRGTSGRGKSEETDEYRCEKFPERPVKNNFRNNMGWKLYMSMFMLDDEKTEALKNTRSMLIGGVGEEIDLLRQLFCDGSFDLHSIYNIRDKKTFPGWEILKEDGHIMPCSDIVIADRYLFGDFDKKTKAFKPVSEALLEKNLFTLLRLFAEEKQEQKVNIVFFTDEMDETFRVSMKKRIESFFGKRNGAKVTFVMFNNDRPHDRFILTNYRLFRSGDSFNNYFDERGNLKTSGLTLDVDSLANNNVCSIVSVIQDWFQRICDNNQPRIFGGKESNFINFKS